MAKKNFDVARFKYCVSITAVIMIIVIVLLSVPALLLKEQVTQNAPYSYVILLGLLLMITGLFSVIADIGYLSSIQNEEIYKKNLDKFSRGELAEVTPLGNIHQTTVSELEDYLVDNARFYALQTKNYVNVFFIYKKKNGGITAKKKNMKIYEFYKFFMMADDVAPEEFEEIKLKFQ